MNRYLTVASVVSVVLLIVFALLSLMTLNRLNEQGRINERQVEQLRTDMTALDHQLSASKELLDRLSRRDILGIKSIKIYFGYNPSKQGAVEPATGGGFNCYYATNSSPTFRITNKMLDLDGGRPLEAWIVPGLNTSNLANFDITDKPRIADHDVLVSLGASSNADKPVPPTQAAGFVALLYVLYAK